MEPIRAKKHLGQHFLKDENIASKIVNSLTLPCDALLEIGPGTGVLTKYLIRLPLGSFKAVDVDRESIPYLKTTFPEKADCFIEGDFLRIDPGSLFEGNFSVIGTSRTTFPVRFFSKYWSTATASLKWCACYRKRLLKGWLHLPEAKLTAS